MLFLNSIRAHVKGLESWRPAEVPCPLLGLNAKRGRRAWDTCGHAPSSGGLGTEGGPATRHNTGGPEGVTLTETSLSQQDAQDGSTYTGPGGQVHRQPAGGWVPGPGAGGALLCRVSTPAPKLPRSESSRQRRELLGFQVLAIPRHLHPITTKWSDRLLRALHTPVKIQLPRGQRPRFVRSCILISKHHLSYGQCHSFTKPTFNKGLSRKHG